MTSPADPREMTQSADRRWRPLVPAIGIVIGAALGLLIGSLFSEISWSIVIGVALGVVAGTVVAASRRR